MRDFANRTSRLVDDKVIAFTRGHGADALHAYFNLSGENRPLPHEVRHDDALLFTSEGPHYGGVRSASHTEHLLPYECLVIGFASTVPANAAGS